LSRQRKFYARASGPKKGPAKFAGPFSFDALKGSASGEFKDIGDRQRQVTAK
jgi:hypothetical protein